METRVGEGTCKWAMKVLLWRVRTSRAKLTSVCFFWGPTIWTHLSELLWCPKDKSWLQTKLLGNPSPLWLRLHVVFHGNLPCSIKCWFLNKRTQFLVLHSRSFIHYLPFWEYIHGPLPSHSQGLKWDKCAPKRFATRGFSSPVPWRCALLLGRISIYNAWTQHLNQPLKVCSLERQCQ